MMTLFRSLLFILVFPSQLKATESQHALNLYLPSIEFRFQDDASQTQTLKTTSQLGIGLTLFHNYSVGLEQSSFEEKTGNETLSISEKMTTSHLVIGYNFYDLELQKENHLKAWILGTYGQSRQEVETQLNSIKSNERNTEDVLGLGALLQFNIKAFLVEFDVRIEQSKNYNPQTINVSHLRFGYQIQF